MWYQQSTSEPNWAWVSMLYLHGDHSKHHYSNTTHSRILNKCHSRCVSIKHLAVAGNLNGFDLH